MSTDLAAIAADYRKWADIEARGSSPSYERLARAVADDDRVLATLAALDSGKRQPNLLFGALRWLGIPVDEPQEAIERLLQRTAEVLAVIRARRTQTNEVARCAALLPALACLPSPLAVVEVGASAGLCLMFDRWRYRYSREGFEHILGAADSPLTLDCDVVGPVPLPAAVPSVVWRHGIDLAPVDPVDPEARRWLTCLVWPEHTERAERLRVALQVAAQDPVSVATGDLVEDLPRLLARAPADATLVVMHSATLAYVDASRRAAFLDAIGASGAHRVGAEGPSVLPHLAGQLPRGIGGRFVVSVDDTVVALASPHGGELVAVH